MSADVLSYSSSFASLDFAKEEKVPIIVALNKVDIKGVDKAKIKRDLSTEGVQIEELGGDVMCLEISAKKNKGIEELLDTILLVAEMNQLKKLKPKKGIAQAVVLESTRDKSLGPISLCIMQAGTLEVGNYAGWEEKCTTIRAIKSEDFCNMESAGEFDPVWLAGFTEEIPIGVTIYFYPDQQILEKEVKEEKSKEVENDEEEEEVEDIEILGELLKSQDKGDLKELGIIVKSESQGTLEVVLKELDKLSLDDVKINVISAATGEITEDDVIKAKTCAGIVIGFKSKILKRTEKVAKQEKVLVRNYEIIYELLDEITEVVDSMKELEEKEVETARAKVKKVFELSDGTKVAGCKVMSGTILKGYRCFVERPSLKRDNRIGDGKITSLRQNKNEIKEAIKDSECGIFIEPQIEIEKDDEIVCFKIEKE